MVALKQEWNTILLQTPLQIEQCLSYIHNNIPAAFALEHPTLETMMVPQGDNANEGTMWK